MQSELFQDYTNLYRETLLNNVIPFWEHNSPDNEHGGFFTCLDRQGNVYDTDKFIWLQARQVWTFSKLYNHIDCKKEWLELAESGIKFLNKFGKDSNGSFYFSLNRRGEPLTHAFNIYSDCFACLAYAEFAKATGEDKYLALALSTYSSYTKRLSNPKGRFEKTTGVRPLKSFGISMMLAYMAFELKGIIDDQERLKHINASISDILDVHYDPHLKIINEYVLTDGTRSDSFEGRLVNPGHGIEAMWFLMDIGNELQNKTLIDQTISITLEILEYGWDNKYGGIYYFLDSKDAPLQQLEWDQKLWWVHLEALIALAKAYYYSGRNDVWTWYNKVHEYAWDKFHDPENGEWFGYLNRMGDPHTTLKGGKWKGCFHTPRAMFECWKTFEKLS